MWRTVLIVLMGLFSAGAAAAGGLRSLVHPINAPPVEAAPRRLAEADRDHVYVLLVNGLDPLRIGNLTGMGDYIRGLGFRHTFYGELWDSPRLAREIRRIRLQDADARIALIGYSFGTNAAHRMADALGRDGVRIDLLIYLAGDTLRNVSDMTPENVGRVINIRAWGMVFMAGGLIRGTDLDRADNYYLRGVLHLAAPSQPFVLDLLSRELTALAERGVGP